MHPQRRQGREPHPPGAGNRMGERPLAEESIACVSRVAAAGRCCSDETKERIHGMPEKDNICQKKNLALKTAGTLP